MQLAAAQARYQRLHAERAYHDGSRNEDGSFASWAKEPSANFPYHWTDGTSIWLAPFDLGLGGDFLEQGLVESSQGVEPPLVADDGDLAGDVAP